MSADQSKQAKALTAEGGQSVALRAIRAEHRPEVNRAVADPFPSGTGAVPSIAGAPSPAPTGSQPFPQGEGTGEQVESGQRTLSARPVPEAGNGSGTGTGELGADHQGATTSFGSPLQPPAVNDAEELRCSGRRPVLSAQQVEREMLTAKYSSWGPLDIRATVKGLMAGTLGQPRPTVAGWLYPAAVNGLAGESGSGKTWTALVSARHELMAGRSVVYVDLEDSPIGIAGRLLALGVPGDVIQEQFAYIRPEEAFRDDVRNDLWRVIDDMQPSLVVLDSTGESMALEGTDPNSDDGVARWFQRVARPIAERGPAVLLIDHLPKSDKAAGSPIGSQRKRAAITGVQMIQVVDKGMSFAKGRPGIARLVCTKDRHGNFVTGEAVLQLIVRPEPSRGEGGVNASLTPISDEEEFAPTRHMEAITDWLSQQGAPQTTAAIKKAVKGKAETLTIALAVLVESGYLTASSGARNATLYTLVEKYALGDDYVVPEASAPCSHEWHESDSACNAAWCHTGHHGSCNRSEPPAAGPPVEWDSPESTPAFVG